MIKSILEKHRVIIVGGSGGVGKTSVSAALAIASAELGHKTLVLTIDPARRLAGALGLNSIGSEIADITDAIRQELHSNQESATPTSKQTGKLYAMMLDVKNTFDEFVRLYAPSKEHATRILENPMYQIIVTRLSGSQEYASMQRLYHIANSNQYDRIILDTPPSTHALDFLNAPFRITRFFDAKLVNLFLTLGKSSGWNVFRPGTSIFLKALDKLSGSGVVADIASFIQLIEPLFEALREEPELARQLISEPRTGFLIVSGPQQEQLADAQQFSKKLVEIDINVSGWIVNRVMPTLSGPPSSSVMCEIIDAPELSSSAIEDDFATNLSACVQRLNNYACIQQQWIKEYRDQSDLFVETVPMFTEDIHSIKGLVKLKNALINSK